MEMMKEGATFFFFFKVTFSSNRPRLLCEFLQDSLNLGRLKVTTLQPFTTTTPEPQETPLAQHYHPITYHPRPYSRTRENETLTSYMVPNMLATYCSEIKNYPFVI